MEKTLKKPHTSGRREDALGMYPVKEISLTALQEIDPSTELGSLAASKLQNAYYRDDHGSLRRVFPKAKRQA